MGSKYNYNSLGHSELETSEVIQENSNCLTKSEWLSGK